MRTRRGGTVYRHTFFNIGNIVVHISSLIVSWSVSETIGNNRLNSLKPVKYFQDSFAILFLIYLQVVKLNCSLYTKFTICKVPSWPWNSNTRITATVAVYLDWAVMLISRVAAVNGVKSVSYTLLISYLVARYIQITWCSTGLTLKWDPPPPPQNKHQFILRIEYCTDKIINLQIDWVQWSPKQCLWVYQSVNRHRCGSGALRTTLRFSSHSCMYTS